MCVISHKHKFAFIHIPKNAGGSVRQALMRRADGFKPGGIYQHAPATTVRDLNPTFWENAYTFAFVRNPWARMWSIYKFNLERKGKGHKDVGHSFDEFLMKKKRRHNWAKTFICPNTPIQRRPQTDWFTDKEGKVIVDYIGRFENLRNELDDICSRLGVPTLKLVRTHKTSDRIHYTEAYSQEGIAFVAEHFKTDIEMFGYKFGE